MVVTSRLLLQIVYPDGEVFQLPAGGPLEMELENQLAERVVEKVKDFENRLAETVAAKGVGLFRTSTQVESALRASFQEQIQIERTFREAFKEVMFEFKDHIANP
jgi:hypothetical protein